MHQLFIQKCLLNKKLYQKDGLKIIKGLKKIKKEINKNKFKFKEQFEDIHQNIEKRLFQIIGGLQVTCILQDQEMIRL